MVISSYGKQTVSLLFGMNPRVFCIFDGRFEVSYSFFFALTRRFQKLMWRKKYPFDLLMDKQPLAYLKTLVYLFIRKKWNKPSCPYFLVNKIIGDSLNTTVAYSKPVDDHLWRAANDMNAFSVTFVFGRTWWVLILMVSHYPKNFLC